MRLDIYIHLPHNHHEEHHQIILNKLESIIKQLLKMPTKAEFEAALAEVGTALDNIAADITRLTDQLEAGGLTATEEQAVFDALRAVADRAKAIADTTPEPTEPGGGETPTP